MTLVSPKVAIIIPTYNVDQYIGECLNSVLDQTYKNISVIAVNDGSTDSSGALLDEYAINDDRIHVIHKRNGGVSSARNAGLSFLNDNLSDSQYLYFLDGDDIIPPNFVEKMVNALERTGADLAVSSFCDFTKTQCKTKQSPAIKTEMLSQDEFAQLYFDFPAWRRTSVARRFLGNKIFRLSLCKNCRFNERLKHAEDQEWCIIHIIPVLHKAVLVPEVQFKYRLRKSSLTRSNKLLQDLDTFSVVVKDLKRYTPSAQKGIQNRFVESLYNELKYYLSKDSKRDSFYLIRELRHIAFSKSIFSLTFKNLRRVLLAFMPQASLIRFFDKGTNQDTPDQGDFFD